MSKENNPITERTIQDLLNAKYVGNCKYKVPNIYVFKEDWESDFFVQKQNWYCYEFEIKISRSDFFADFKKTTKHDILKNGRYFSTNWHEHKYRPNKLYYVVPYNMISLDEVPIYAGLMYVVDGMIITAKEAPFIHKEKLRFEDKLCHKFYHYWMDSKIKIREMNRDIEYYKNTIKSLKINKEVTNE